MASYHLSVKPVSRAQGRSATAAAAYRAAALIECEREGRVHDYTRRSGVAHTEIFVPVGVFVSDRSLLWNAAEAAEKRKDARVAREFEIALPVELSPAARLSLAQQLAREIVERHGNAVDLAVHRPGDGDDRNHHAHLLTTTRQLGPDGFGAKCRELDDQKQGPKEIEYWRERWAALQNQALERAGAEDRVTHEARSYEEVMQGRAPTIHLGPDVAEMERRGVVTERGDHNRAVAAFNQERKSLLSLIAEKTNQILVMDALPSAKVPATATVAAKKPVVPVTMPPPKPKVLTPAEQDAKVQQDLQRLAVERQARLVAIQRKAEVREKKRLVAYHSQLKTEPQPPVGMSAALRQRSYAREHDRWRAIVVPLQELARQATALRVRISEALKEVRKWALDQLRKDAPKEVDQWLARQAEAEKVRAIQIEAQRAEQQRVEAAARAAAESARQWTAYAERIAKQGQVVHTEIRARRLPPPGTVSSVFEVAQQYNVLLKTHAPDQALKLLARNLFQEHEAALRQKDPGKPLPLLDRVAKAQNEQEKPIAKPTKDRDQDLER